MTENLSYYLRHGYVEIHRAGQDGFRRVYFRKPLDHSGQMRTVPAPTQRYTSVA